MRANANLSRYKRIYRLRLSGMKFREIGETVGVSRQRAWEIFKRMEKRMAQKATPSKGTSEDSGVRLSA
jgi:predicted DNA-binding protein (UPF0251 family)